MTSTIRDPGEISGYHAHLYYDRQTRPAAAALREEIGRNFPDVLLGRWHEAPVGPHPISMYQVAFSVADFPRFVPWLMLNRGVIVILVHPETGDDYQDHAEHALWLGEKLPLNLEFLRRIAARS
jgi:aromatic ring-cleaving dioxygenase